MATKKAKITPTSQPPLDKAAYQALWNLSCVFREIAQRELSEKKKNRVIPPANHLQRTRIIYPLS